MMYEPVSVIIRGQLFPSQAAAARHFSVAQSCVYNALERGKLDGVGLGRNYNIRKPIWLDGVEYESRRALARHMGIEPGILHNWISRSKRRGHKAYQTKWGVLTWTP